jgi:hypothetical protein
VTSESIGKPPIRVGACLSLTGKYARFGTQAAHALRVWQDLDGSVELIVEDDESDPRTLETLLPQVARRSEMLLGPYSTQLMKTAGRIAEDNDWLLWNHGGSGDDVEIPGYVVSVLAPTSRYSEPFLRYLTANHSQIRLVIARGKGSFGQQVASGAAQMASAFGITATQIGPHDQLPTDTSDTDWSLFSAGVFEQDIEIVKRAQASAHPPQTVCAVAAGVRGFEDFVEDPTNIFGIAQWFPGSTEEPELGPAETEFLSAYLHVSHATPDYPAVQALAGAVIATHCARQSGETTRSALWTAAATLDTTTLYGGFKINPTTGTQAKHETVLVQWTPNGLMRV